MLTAGIEVRNSNPCTGLDLGIRLGIEPNRLKRCSLLGIIAIKFFYLQFEEKTCYDMKEHQHRYHKR